MTGKLASGAGDRGPRQALDATAGNEVGAAAGSRPQAGEAGGPQGPASRPAQRQPILEAPHQPLTKQTAAQDEGTVHPIALREAEAEIDRTERGS